MPWTQHTSTDDNSTPTTGGGNSSTDPGAPTNNPAPIDAVVVEYGRVLDLVSEGPIVGLVNGLKSVFLDDTPIQNPDTTFNFKGLNVVGLKGTNSQTWAPGFPSVESEVAVSTKVTTATPVVRSISTTGATAARVKVKIPALQDVNATTGQASGTLVQIAIDVQNNGGGYVAQTLANNGQIYGKFTTAFTRGFRVALPGSGPWDIRVRRITADSGSAYLQNDVYYESLTTITDSKLRYPNSAVFGLVADAKQFRSIPSRAYEIKGRIVSVPTNYDPVARTYATSGLGTTGGLWDGTFKQAWTDNPAWIWYDAATSTRYGGGAFLDATKIDKYALYTISQNCDVSVSDGKGGNEPRFTCNAYIQTRTEAIKFLNDLAGVFRGMAYWASGTVVPVQDLDSSPAALFTAANVEDGRFTYTGTALKARHTAALVTWNDPNNGYRQAKEYVEDAAGIARYGLNVAEAVAFACTSQGQARRVGAWLLASELTETETVTFRTGLEGIVARPGEVIQIQDQFRAGQRFGGRVASGATTTTVPLDSSVTLAPATSYQLSVVLSDGTVSTKTVSTGAGTVTSLTVSAAFPSAPPAQAEWVLAVVGATSLWRIVSISEVEPTKFEVTALAHNASKYSAIDTGTVITPTTAPPVVTQFAPVTGLTATSTLQVLKDQLRAILQISWTGNANATGYVAEYSENFQPWVPMVVSGLTAQDWVAPGSTYRVRVMAAYEGGLSPFVETSYSVPTPSAVATDAAAAQTSANSALADLAKIASDSWLSRGEKAQASADYNDLNGSWTDLLNKASAAGVSSTAFNTAMNTLATYLSGLTPPWYDTTADTAIVPATWSANWAAAYNERVKLLNAITAAAQGDADYADGLARGSHNLIKNGNSEAVNPTGVEAAGVSSALSYQGTKSRLITGVGVGSEVGLAVTGDISCVEGERISGQCYAVTNVGGSCALMARWLNAAGGTVGAVNFATLTGTGAWAFISGECVVPSGAAFVRLEIRVNAPAGNGAYFDCLYAERISQGAIYADAMARSSYNLIKNGNSEMVNPTGWEAVGISASGAYSGSKCRMVSVASGAGYLQIQEFPCAEGESFYYEAMIDVAGNARGILDITYFNAAGTNLGAPVQAWTETPGYRKVTMLTSTAPAGAVLAKVYLGVSCLLGSTNRYAFFDSLYLTKKVGAGVLEADLGIFGVIRSGGGAGTGDYVAGTSSAAPQGFKVSGVPFTTTFLDGTTDTNCQMELGGSANIGGYKAAVVVNNAVGSTTSWSSAGTYNWTCPTGITSVEITLQGGGGNGGSSSGGGGGGGAYIRKRVTVVPGTVYTVVVGGAAAASTMSGSGFSTVTADPGANGASGSGGGAGGASVYSSGGAGGATLGTSGSDCPWIAYEPEVEWDVPGAGGAGGFDSVTMFTKGGSCGRKVGGNTGGRVTPSVWSGGGGGGASVMGNGGSGGSNGAVGNAGGTGAGGGGGAGAAAGGAGGVGFARIRY